MIRILLLLLCAPFMVMAQGEQQGFFIETIEIVGARSHSVSVLESTLQLEEGKRYTELDLRLAVYRVESLRFVLQAKMRLLRGSKRGAYKLQVKISETKKFFYVLLSELGVTQENYLAEGDFLETDVDPDAGVRLSGLTLGKRWFPGRNGELNVFFPFNPGISYTHYNLFNRNVVASVALQWPGGFGRNYSAYPEDQQLTRVEDRNSLGLTYSMGMMLSSAHSLSFNYKLNAGEISYTQPIFGDVLSHEDTNFRNHKAEIVWTYDTKDHPLFPTTGVAFNGGILLEREFRDAANDDFDVPYDWLEANSYFAYFRAQRFWDFGPNRTIGITSLARMGETSLSSTEAEPYIANVPNYSSAKINLSALLARNILNVQIFGKPRDFRLEAEVFHELNRTDLPAGFFPDPEFNRTKARLSVTARDHWGLIRLSLVYRSVNEELWQ